ncbi:hypothetical protein [Cryobacterium arcticum]|uniref:Uncharacterized protein n=1 Tax=Cryobacterium arcticum TaxID=670052 RepID=A0A317ZSG1_9MICO|nr:hypothetical protein [Cryobacterium arcticum]PXA67227.1 hypothetical protein CTB96_10730 [Cryobacterium arcticum]
MTHHTDAPAGRPEFDPQRSAEIRRLLIRTVAGTSRPRIARLSRTSFALAATVALLCAGGVGAGSVVVYDRLAHDSELTAQSAATENGHDSVAEAAADSTAESQSGLSPAVMLNGQLGYAYDVDLYSVMATSASGVPTSDGQFLSDAEASDLDLNGFAAASLRVPIYLADGVTVIGYIEPRALAR